MRKSVIFAIALIYFISMVVVTFFGLRTKVDQFTIYFTSINITSYDRTASNIKYRVIHFDETEGFTSTFIAYEYAPKNVSYPENVEFSLTNDKYEDENGNIITVAQISKFGELIFFQKASVYVWVRAKDGSGAKDSVLIICK